MKEHLSFDLLNGLRVTCPAWQMSMLHHKIGSDVITLTYDAGGNGIYRRKTHFTRSHSAGQSVREETLENGDLVLHIPPGFTNINLNAVDLSPVSLEETVALAPAMHLSVANGGWLKPKVLEVYVRLRKVEFETKEAA